MTWLKERWDALVEWLYEKDAILIAIVVVMLIIIVLVYWWYRTVAKLAE